MRVGVLLPGVAAVGVLALPGCGGGDDPVRTVTVTSPGAAATTSRSGTPARPTTTERARPTPPRTTTIAPATTTVVETTTAERPPDPPTTTTPPEDPATGARGTAAPGPETVEPDPVGGTTAARGRADGTGYSVRVPDGWNDGAKRLEGSSVDFDRLYVKGRGSAVTSSILVARSTPAGARRRGIEGLATTVRRQVASGAGGADVERSAARPVDGEDAIAFVVRRSLGDTAIVQRQVAVVRGGALFVVGLTAPRRAYDDDARTLADFLASWRWEDGE